MASTFGADSTTDQVLDGVDLRGRRILVTGVSAGLGVETARALVAHGAQVVGAARDLAKAQRATESVRAAASLRQGSFDLIELDLASLASVRRTARSLLDKRLPFDVVIANAGVMACPLARTKDGFEMQFGTNHLGHFVLINHLLPLLRQPSRVVSLSSAGHRFADVDLEDPNFERTPYVEFIAYGRSKTANVLFAVEFDRRHRHQGIRAAAVHPGAIQTELGRSLTPQVTEQVKQFNAGVPAFAAIQQWKSVPQGAATSVWAAVVADAQTIGGHFCEDCHVAEVVPPSPAPGAGVRSYAVDPQRARALWQKSEHLVDERFPSTPETPP